eukprot:6202409-Prymnesium_polylepis.1
MVAAGECHHVFIDDNQRLLTCGDTAAEAAATGQAEYFDDFRAALGHGPTRVVPSPTPVAALRGVHVTSVSASSYHTLVLSEGGIVHSFGTGFWGQLGHGHEEQQHTNLSSGDAALAEDESTPRLIDALRGTRVLSVSAGAEHSLVLNDRGVVYAFGRGCYGQLGLTDCRKRVSPTEALRETRVVAVAAGTTHSVVLSDTGEAFSFGSGDGTGAMEIPVVGVSPLAFKLRLFARLRLTEYDSRNATEGRGAGYGAPLRDRSGREPDTIPERRGRHLFAEPGQPEGGRKLLQRGTQGARSAGRAVRSALLCRGGGQSPLPRVERGRRRLLAWLWS